MKQLPSFNFRFDHNSVLALLILLPFIFACSKLNVGSKETSKPKEKGLVGTWKNKNATLQIKANGTMLINNVKYLYKASKDVITLTGNDGSAEIPYTLDGDSLTITYQEKKTGYERVKQSSDNDDNAGGGGVRRELVGKWCYLSSVTTNDGGRMSDRCITLRENGTYEYYAETTSSGDNGGTYSQTSDNGTWSATEETITANSKSEGTHTYSLEKRNHPKTGDPMIILDGDAYVTYNQRNPW